MSVPIRPNVLEMEPYQPGKPIDEVKRELGLDRVVKLASNENPFGPSPKAVAAVKAAAGQMHIYPDGAAYDLKQALAAKYNVPAGNLIVGNGSDELIHLLGLALLEPGDELIMGDPGFSRYDASAHLAPCTLTKIPLDEDLKHDLPAILAAITDRTRLIFIANPNNPTGTILRKLEVDEFLAKVPSHVLVVLDEAYFDFACHVSDFPNAIPYVLEGKNVVSLRTFSKAYGLAGLRVGFGIAPEYVVDAIQRAREPFNVNSLAQIAAIAALEDDEHLIKTVKNNREGADRLAAAFKAVGARPFESFANFVYADLGRPAQPVFEEILKLGVITRSGAALGKPTGLRVSIGTPEEIDIFIDALNKVMARTPAAV